MAPSHKSSSRLITREKIPRPPKPKNSLVFPLILAIAAIFPLGAILCALQGKTAWVIILAIPTIIYESGQMLLILLWIRFGPKYRQLQPQKGPRPKIAVIIPAWNESMALPETLATVLAQDDPPENIIVSDDGSTDDTIPKLSNLYQLQFQDQIGYSQIYPNLQLLCKEHSGKGDSLNQAIALSDADVVLILDADTRLHQGSIYALRRRFTFYPSLTAVSGTLIPCCSDSWTGKWFQFSQRYEYARQHLWRLAWSYLNSTLIISGACSAFRRELLLEIGGFSTSSWVEDYEIMYRIQRHLRLRRRPCRVMVEPKLSVETDAPETIYTFLRQRRRWAGGFLETLIKYRKMVGDRRFGILGCGYLLHNTLTIVSPFYSLAWLISGLILSVQNVSYWYYGVEIALVTLGLAIVTSSLTIISYRYHFRRREVSAIRAIIDVFLRPIFYLPMIGISHLWGYSSYLRRQKTW